MQEWYFLVMIQTTGLITCMTVMFNYFKGDQKTLIVGVFLVAFGLISMMEGIYGGNESILSNIINNFGWLVYASAVWIY